MFIFGESDKVYFAKYSFLAKVIEYTLQKRGRAYFDTASFYLEFRLFYWSLVCR